MSNRHPKTSAFDCPRQSPGRSFTAAPVRHRRDGWTPEKQVDFIEALAESGCVTEACERVGMSTQSAYALRARIDAQSFRIAWDTALDYAVRCLSDAAFSRALKGVVRPVFYQGEQVGERRYFDERLTMFLLRYRDPQHYGAWLDQHIATQHPDGPAILLSKAVQRVALDAYATEAGDPPPRHPPFATARIVEEEELEERRQNRREAAEDAREQARMHRARREEEEFWSDYEREPQSDAGTIVP